MAGAPWFRIGRSGRAVPIARAGWIATFALVAIELAGAALLILAPEARHEPIGWDRALGWAVLAAGNIAFFISLSAARLAPHADDR